MENELISVIIPVYNTERYLAACLDSVLTQSYHNLEVIIIDDGSTDYSLKIAEGYAETDDRIKVYSFQNEGLSEARNRGISVATGSFLTFVDSDDLILPNSLEIMLGIMKENNADLIQGEVVRDGHIKSNINKTEITQCYINSKDAILDVLYQKKLLSSAWGKLYKTEIFKDLRFTPGILYEDLDLIYRILEICNKIIIINYPVYFYRNTAGSILNTWNPKRLHVLKITEEIENYMTDKYPDLLPAAKDRRLSANFNIFAFSSKHGDKETASKCWQHIKNNRNYSLFNPKVRLKNKAGVLLSYFGKHVFKFAARKFYK